MHVSPEGRSGNLRRGRRLLAARPPARPSRAYTAAVASRIIKIQDRVRETWTTTCSSKRHFRPVDRRSTEFLTRHLQPRTPTKVSTPAPIRPRHCRPATPQPGVRSAPLKNLRVVQDTPCCIYFRADRDSSRPMGRIHRVFPSPVVVYSRIIRRHGVDAVRATPCEEPPPFSPRECIQ